MRLSLFLTFAVLLASLCGPARALDAASAPQEKLPIEIELLYDKLLKVAPDYDRIIRSAHILPEDDKKFGQSALLAQQRLALQTLYDKSGPGSLFLAKARLKIVLVDANKRSAVLEGVDADQPIIYEGLTGEKFGIFITNSKEAMNPAPPYSFEDYPKLASYVKYGTSEMPADLTINPVAADATDFILPNGQNVHVILAEITSFEMSAPDHSRLLLRKQLKVISTEPDSSLSKLFNGTASTTRLPGARQ